MQEGINVVSLFSGIGGLDEGLRRAGLRHVLLCESDAWRRSVLRERFPGVPIVEDVRLVGCGMVGRGRSGDDSLGARLARRDDADLVCGGFPCQDLSVAGARRGLAGDRSGLFYEFARAADDLISPGGYVLIENVPGLLSSQNGRDFAIVLATMAELGFHDLAWRILDSRYFGVPQDGDASSSLVDVLEETVARKYFLSPRAAAGILRRAQIRGRVLPPLLAAALASVAGRTTPNE